MPRPPRSRRVHGPPRFVSFKPAGVPRRMLEQVLLRVDQFEALRLADYEKLSQADAAEAMGISPATFSRLIESARYSLAQAIIEGKRLDIEGGAVDYVHTLQRCEDCGDEALIELKSGKTAGKNSSHPCRHCGSENVEDLVEAMKKGNEMPEKREHQDPVTTTTKGE